MTSRRKKTPLADRFHKKIKVEEDGCWLWTASGGSGGYGRIRDRNLRNCSAHRVSYELHVGPIPEGLHVLHKCDNPPCVNPFHLFVGTNHENAIDCVIKGRRPTGEDCAFAKLTESAVRYIRRSTETRGELAERFGVNYQTIKDVHDGRTWRHVKLEE